MIIEHQLEFHKNKLNRQLILARIVEGMPEFFNWDATLENEKIAFKHDGKIRLFRAPAENIKSGTIELVERTNTVMFICKTEYPNYYLLFSFFVLIVGLVQKYALGFPVPLFIIIILPLLLYFGNFFALKKSFQWSTNKVLKYVMEDKEGS